MNFFYHWFTNTFENICRKVKFSFIILASTAAVFAGYSFVYYYLNNRRLRALTKSLTDNESAQHVVQNYKYNFKSGITFQRDSIAQLRYENSKPTNPTRLIGVSQNCTNVSKASNNHAVKNLSFNSEQQTSNLTLNYQWKNGKNYKENRIANFSSTRETKVSQQPTLDRYPDVLVLAYSDDHTVDVEKKTTTFQRMDLPLPLLRNVLGIYNEPTPIQQHAITHALDGRDILGWSATGTGKTAAYVIPILTLLIENGDLEDTILIDPVRPLAVVILPTRELAIQIFEDFQKLSRGTNAQIINILGGRSSYQEKRTLRKGCDILVATPGRLLDYINDNLICLSECLFFVLDEADRILDMGFEPTIREIVERGAMSPKTDRQTFLFSATFPRAAQEFANEYLDNNYVHIKAGASERDLQASADHVNVFGNEEEIYVLNSFIQQKLIDARYDKFQKLLNILIENLDNARTSSKWNKKILIFLEQRYNAPKIAKRLTAATFPTKAIYSGLEQLEREDALRQFASGQYPILVATSVAARGLDIKNVDIVINYELPSGYDGEGYCNLSVKERIAIYVQRIGRTGRMEQTGLALTFYDANSVDKDIGLELKKLLVAAYQEIPNWFLQTVGNLTHDDDGWE